MRCAPGRTRTIASPPRRSEEGTLFLPDPNFFGGELRFTRRDKPARSMPRWEHPFSAPNQKHGAGRLANYRTAELADMALAIGEGRPHRCSLELALHAVEVMRAILRSGEEGRFVAMRTSCERPQALGPKEAAALLRRGAANQKGRAKPSAPPR